MHPESLSFQSLRTFIFGSMFEIELLLRMVYVKELVVLFSWVYICPLNPGDDVWLLLLDECYCHLILVLTIWWCPLVESSIGLLGKGVCYNQRGGSEVKASACNTGDLGLIPGSGRSSGEGNGNPLQYSCLENPMGGGAWCATVHGVAKSWTWLSDLTNFLLRKLLAFTLLNFVSKAKLACYNRCLLASYFCIPVPYNKKNIFFFVLFCLVLEGLVGLRELFNFSFFSISSWGIGLDYYDIEWFALEINWDHSVIFEVAPKYCISDSFVDWELLQFF